MSSTSVTTRTLGAVAALLTGAGVAAAGAAAAGTVADGSSGKLDEAAPGAAGATTGDVALDADVAVVAADCTP